ncbi:MAG: VWA domain-containing protein [Pirellulales bacterium]
MTEFPSSLFENPLWEVKSTVSASSPKSSKSSLPPPLPASGDDRESRLLPILGVLAAIVMIAFAIALARRTDSQGPHNTGDAPVASASESVRSSSKPGDEIGGGGAKSESGTNSDQLDSENGSTVSSEVESSRVAPNYIENSVAGEAAPHKTEGTPESSDTSDARHAPIAEGASTNNFFTIGSSPVQGIGAAPEVDINKASAAFFGVEAKGIRFAYVVDVSGSMSGSKFEKARAELIKSINALGNNQYVFVAFYNDAPYFQPTEKLRLAHPRGKSIVKDWIMHAIPSGGTSPFEAVEFAIRLRPDSVFILSDGEFDASEVANILRANSELRIPIHTIGFQTDAGTLKRIAKDNDGTYRFVP